MLFLCCFPIAFVLHRVVPKPPKWELPPKKPGMHERGRLPVFHRQSDCGKPEDFYTPEDLGKRNLTIIAIHYFVLLMEPYEYLRF
jgi:hypothetical protein